MKSNNNSRLFTYQPIYTVINTSEINFDEFIIVLIKSLAMSCILVYIIYISANQRVTRFLNRLKKLS